MTAHFAWKIFHAKTAKAVRKDHKATRKGLYPMRHNNTLQIFYHRLEINQWECVQGCESVCNCVSQIMTK